VAVILKVIKLPGTKFPPEIEIGKAILDCAWVALNELNCLEFEENVIGLPDMVAVHCASIAEIDFTALFKVN
jgi:hypothetical protein